MEEENYSKRLIFFFFLSPESIICFAASQLLSILPELPKCVCILYVGGVIAMSKTKPQFGQAIIIRFL